MVNAPQAEEYGDERFDGGTSTSNWVRCLQTLQPVVDHNTCGPDHHTPSGQ